MSTDHLSILKVYELEPRVKHPRIFDSFDQLLPGTSFIIENDHDPIPLYYELKAERKSELGGFDYLEKGPELWRVQITKAGKLEDQPTSCSIGIASESTPMNAGTSDNSCHTNFNKTAVTPEVEGESCDARNSPLLNSQKILDVTTLEPRHKHPTIFAWFNDLAEGEEFILRNDHDPKPLYYQMLGELGQVFNWEYKEQGPIWWVVLIQKKRSDEPTVGEIAAKDMRKAEAMRKLGIDFCCGGNKTIKNAAAEAGISADQLNHALNEIDQQAEVVVHGYDKWDADFLADYIYNQHHKYFYEVREIISRLSIKVTEVHGETQPELNLVSELITKLFTELNSHFYKEEKILFPYIKELVQFKREGRTPQSQLSLSEGPLALMHMEHEEAGGILKNIRTATNDYTLPAHACNSFRQLYGMLEELERDLHQHIHLENNVLFPKAMQLEK